MRARLQNLAQSLRLPSSSPSRKSSSRGSSFTTSPANSSATNNQPQTPQSEVLVAPGSSSSEPQVAAPASSDSLTSHPRQQQQSSAMATPSSSAPSLADLPASWHTGPGDGFHGKVSPESGPFAPEKGRYHLYIGLFCPFAHRALMIARMKQLERFAGLEISVVRPYPKGDENGWPGWRFNLPGDETPYKGATIDPLFGSEYLHEIYFKADKQYSGRYSVPVLWDKRLNTIVNNESLELLRDLQTSFNSLLPPELAEIDLYPKKLRGEIDRVGGWMQRDLNTGVYKAGFAPDQATYEVNIPGVFASLNALEKLAKSNLGPYLLGPALTELDIRAYATLIRFDVVYVQHFKCNLGMIRYSYPILHNWMKNLYWNFSAVFGESTVDFRHIKENYTKSHPRINPLAITPVGPYPDIERGYYRDWRKIEAGGVAMPEVLEWEKRLRAE